jgi:hypothetical protein
MKIVEDGLVYEVIDVGPGVTEKRLLGGLTIERVEGGEKVTYTFDADRGDYVETGREPYTPPPVELGFDTITQLQLAIAELAETIEQDKTAIHLALAELAEIIAGGDE